MSNSLMAARDAFLSRFPEQRIEIDGRSWGLIDTGIPGGETAMTDGPCFLFLPGTLGRADVFFRQIEAMAPHMRVIAVSYPESGGVVEWAADLTELMERLRVGQTAVLGSSLGGYLAQYFAAERPDLVTHLFAANTLHSVEGIDQRPPYSSDLWNAPIAELRAGFAAGMNAWRAAHPEHAEMVDFLLAEADGRIPEPEMRARLDAIKTGPVLPPLSNTHDTATVIEASDDPLIPPPMRAAVRERNAPAPAFRFLWGGHFPYLLRPDLYTSLLLARLGVATLSPDWTKSEDGTFQA
ncbi:alpha/beta hydrolase [Rhodobacter sp. NTK016B]|uniref:alpha/beta fold hydrolase n=1 Tax=Rhodobacter sp. NTK016B TaxID=2759676 RepID=UPI001A8FB6D4|nr:alpha/beta hydrolase [Rhodobacter sp. NTK016B]MBN8293574.1 alpha/beta hydrolase [Rhodobacter sp. NTK016B]